MPGPAGPAPQLPIGRTAPEAGLHLPGWEEPGRFKAAVTGVGGVRRPLPPPLRRQWRSAASPRAPRGVWAAAATCEGREASPPPQPGARPARCHPGRRAVCRSPLLTQIFFTTAAVWSVSVELTGTRAALAGHISPRRCASHGRPGSGVRGGRAPGLGCVSASPAGRWTGQPGEPGRCFGDGCRKPAQDGDTAPTLHEQPLGGGARIWGTVRVPAGFARCSPSSR